jgi:hypothetical protein
MEKYPNGTKMPNLATQVSQMLPTPIAGDWKGQKRKDGTASMLSGKAALGMLPTPRTTDVEGGKSNLGEDMAEIGYQHLGTTSQLNPLFVEEMMGFPANWTVSPFLNGEKNQSKDTATQ